jgi:hypothetical protein
MPIKAPVARTWFSANLGGGEDTRPNAHFGERIADLYEPTQDVLVSIR